MDSREYSWTWVTADRLLSLGPCELISAHIVVGQNNNKVTFYDGENTSGDIIVMLQSAARTGVEFSPKVPVYCRRGLYADLTDNVDGVFVQWRELPLREAE